MNERRIDDLLRLLDGLHRLQAEGFMCRTEISEVIARIMLELEVDVEESEKPSHKSVTVHTKGNGFEKKYDLTDVPTAQLADELAKREGVSEYKLGAHGGIAQLDIEEGRRNFGVRIEGPARIIVNKD